MNRSVVAERSVIVLSVVALLMRFWRLDSVPVGFHSDEAVALANSVCLRHTGVDLWGHSWSFFSGGPINDAGYVVGAPSHLFALYSLWLSAAGDTIAAARAFEVIVSSIVVAATVGIAHNFLGRRGAIWALGLSAIAPWTWTLSRVAFVSPNFVTMHLFVGLWVVTRHVRRRDDPTTTELVVGGVLIGMAASRYYSTLSAVLIAGLFAWYLVRRESTLHRPFIFSGVAVTAFFAMQTGLSAYASRRIDQMPISDALAKESSILGKARTLLDTTWDGLLDHVGPDFLFFRGDPNLRHHSGWGGQLSWPQILLVIVLPLVVAELVRRRTQYENEARLMIVAFLGALGGLLTSSATGEGINANRALVSAPFLVLLCVVVAVYLAPRMRFFTIAVVGSGIVFFGSFVGDYFSEYGERSARSFHVEIRIAGEQARRTGDFAEFERRLPEFREKYGLLADVGLVFFEAAGSGRGCPGYRSN